MFVKGFTKIIICLDQESGTAKYSVEALSKDKKKLDLFTRNRDILRSSSTRQPVFSCYGLHEWAMLYKNNEKKQSLQLRLPQEKIDEVVESVPLRCTHYDAFRFFEKSAQFLFGSGSMAIQSMFRIVPGTPIWSGVKKLVGRAGRFI